MCYMVDILQETNENWDLKDLVQMAGLVTSQKIYSHKWFQASVFPVVSFLLHENALSSVAKSYSVLYQSCTLIAPIFAHLQLSASPDF